MKEEVLDCTVGRARFGRGFGPVVRQTAKLTNEYEVVTTYVCPTGPSLGNTYIQNY
jgi:hypothetical protein